MDPRRSSSSRAQARRLGRVLDQCPTPAASARAAGISSMKVTSPRVSHTSPPAARWAIALAMERSCFRRMPFWTLSSMSSGAAARQRLAPKWTTRPTIGPVGRPTRGRGVRWVGVGVGARNLSGRAPARTRVAMIPATMASMKTWMPGRVSLRVTPSWTALTKSPTTQKSRVDHLPGGVEPAEHRGGSGGGGASHGNIPGHAQLEEREHDGEGEHHDAEDGGAVLPKGADAPQDRIDLLGVADGLVPDRGQRQRDGHSSRAGAKQEAGGESGPRGNEPGALAGAGQRVEVHAVPRRRGGRCGGRRWPSWAEPCGDEVGLGQAGGRGESKAE